MNCPKLDAARVAELKKKHSLDAIYELYARDEYAGEGWFYVKPVSRQQYAKFKADSRENDAAALHNFLCDICVSPAPETLGPLFEATPGLIEKIADEALKTTGVGASVAAKKL
jgi:hypothetical protein